MLEVYVVWCPTSNKPITKPFYDGNLAARVAEKMSETHSGLAFLVMKMQKFYLKES